MEESVKESLSTSRLLELLQEGTQNTSKNDISFHNPVYDLNDSSYKVLPNIVKNAEESFSDSMLLEEKNLEKHNILNNTIIAKPDSLENKIRNNYSKKDLQKEKGRYVLYQEIINLLNSDNVEIDIDKIIENAFAEKSYIKVWSYFTCYKYGINSAKLILEYINKYTKDDILRLIYFDNCEYTNYEDIMKNSQIFMQGIKKINPENIQWTVEQIKENFNQSGEDFCNLFPKDFLQHFSKLDTKGKGLIHYAANYCGKEVMAFLVKAGVDIAFPTNENTNALYIAVEAGNLQSLQVLLSKKELFNSLENTRQTLLQLAESKLQIIGEEVKKIQIELESTDNNDEIIDDLEATQYDPLAAKYNYSFNHN